ncbi:MAG: hypothetical protein IPF98_11395 [Gemmatimonadetes bacterium]|nr:hypothetical protein [Gemmatimonadota bacterium]MCC6771694.1 hypothetical protein [Gemmatimonadaceae bacterium]
MTFNEHQRGYQDGYHGTPTALPRSLSESLGRDTGQAHRDLDRQRAQGADGYENLPPRYGLYAILLFAVFAVARWKYDANWDASLLVVTVATALILARRMHALLRGLTPLYLGLCAGAALGGWSLVRSGDPVSLGNLAMPLTLGGAVGLACILFARRRRS